MRSVRALYVLTEDIPRGRKFAKKGAQGAWKDLTPEMREKYLGDLEGYFGDWEVPEKEVAQNSFVWEEGGDIHLAFVEEGGQEVVSVWNDSTDEWDHLEPGAHPERKGNPDDVDIDGNKRRGPESHRELTGPESDPRKMSAPERGPSASHHAALRQRRARG